MVDVLRPHSQPHDVTELLAGAPLDPDDSTVTNLGSCHVDYFSHTWDESDLQKSWRFTTKHKDNLFNGRRLENASWRRWFQDKFHLQKLDPAELNWFKDSDICWLYGPIFYATPVNDRRAGGTVANPSGIIATASAVDLVQRQSTPSTGENARPLTKSDSLEKLNLIDGGHHHPPLKSALKKREADDIVSVIRRERELLHNMAEQDFKMGKRSTSPGRLSSRSSGMARSKSTSDLSNMRFGPGALSGGKSGRMVMGTPMIENGEPKWSPAPSAEQGAHHPKPTASRMNLADLLAEAASKMEDVQQTGGPGVSPAVDSEGSRDDAYGFPQQDKHLRFSRKVEQRIIFDLYTEEDVYGSEDDYESEEDVEEALFRGVSRSAGRVRRGSVARKNIATTGSLAPSVLKVDDEDDDGTGPEIVDPDVEIGLVQRGPAEPQKMDEDEDDESSEDEGLSFGARKPPAAPASAPAAAAANASDPAQRPSSPGLIDGARSVASFIGSVVKNNLGGW
ncbi:hypothetical protein DFJ74DRAFT_705748 [Hyaloraphidium curvatum]|nr:hypothetical protein DFJ74DRAFT_705748 [Hyaloraphidium curvatum]